MPAAERRLQLAVADPALRAAATERLVRGQVRQPKAPRSTTAWSGSRPSTALDPGTPSVGPNFGELTADLPDEMLERLETDSIELSQRLVDLFAPVGRRWQRGVHSSSLRRGRTPLVHTHPLQRASDATPSRLMARTPARGRRDGSARVADEQRREDRRDGGNGRARAPRVEGPAPPASTSPNSRPSLARRCSRSPSSTASTTPRGTRGRTSSTASSTTRPSARARSSPAASSPWSTTASGSCAGTASCPAERRLRLAVADPALRAPQRRLRHRLRCASPRTPRSTTACSASRPSTASTPRPPSVAPTSRS